ncbi:MAG: hypothetical protein GX147_06230 [Deltaproteobacteria bacterium]|nr:hypothetical protein [Deltaproteobacteria bacterium]
MKRTCIASLVLFMSIFVNSPAMCASLKIISPNGGETPVIGKPVKIQWSAVGIKAKVRLVLLKGGQEVGIIADGLNAKAASYSWTAGQYAGGTAAVGQDYKVRICTVNNQYCAMSNGFFALRTGMPSHIQSVQPSAKTRPALMRERPKIHPAGTLLSQINITSPVANERYRAETPIPVTWDRNSVKHPELHLYLLDGQGNEMERKQIPNTGQYNGLVITKDYTFPGWKFQVKLVATNPGTADTTQTGNSGFFTLRPLKETITLQRTGKVTNTFRSKLHSDDEADCLFAPTLWNGRQPVAGEIKIGHSHLEGKHKKCYYSAAYYFRGHAHFDLNEIKGKEILDATLYLTDSGYEARVPDGTLATNEQLDTKCEIYLDGAGFAKGVLASFFPPGEGKIKSVNVIEAVRYWAGGNANEGLLFKHTLEQVLYVPTACIKYYKNLSLEVRYID